MEKPLVCPWCGKDNCYIGTALDDDAPIGFCVRCAYCMAAGPKSIWKDFAVDQWNAMSQRMRSDAHETAIPRHEVRHQDVRVYLLKEGWQISATIGNKCEVFSPFYADHDNQWEILVPLRSNLGDYRLRMDEAVATLVNFEGRSELAVLNDITNRSQIEPPPIFGDIDDPTNPF